jgi:hypothetical protein
MSEANGSVPVSIGTSPGAKGNAGTAEYVARRPFTRPMVLTFDDAAGEAIELATRVRLVSGRDEPWLSAHPDETLALEASVLRAIAATDVGATVLLSRQAVERHGSELRRLGAVFPGEIPPESAADFAHCADTAEGDFGQSGPLDGGGG